MTENPGSPVALVVDDDEIFNKRLSMALANREWNVKSAHDGAMALQLASRFKPVLAVVDLRLPGMSGLDVIYELRQQDSKLVVIMLTGYASIATAVAATKLGANHYLKKPVDADQILGAYVRILKAESEAIHEDPEKNIPSLAMVEWEYMQRVLTDCGGNVSQAAKLLGLHRKSLQRKLSKYPPQK